MWRTCAEIAGVVVLLLSGLVHGLWTQRWQPSSALDEAVARLDRVPLTIGSWHGQALDLDPAQAAQAGLAGWCYRRYEDAHGRGAVSVMLLCGPPGPVSVHTPDMCFPGAGYEMLGQPVPYTAPSAASAQPAAFWTAGFSTPGLPIPQHLRVFWAWNTAGPWQAPKNPRLVFAPQRALYKLYVLCETMPADEGLEERLCTEFLPVLLPALQEALSAGNQPPNPGKTEHRG
jgi:hypothetical protein